MLAQANKNPAVPTRYLSHMHLRSNPLPIRHLVVIAAVGFNVEQLVRPITRKGFPIRSGSERLKHEAVLNVAPVRLIAHNALDEMHGSIGEQEVGALGMHARKVVQTTVLIGLRIV